MQGGGGAAAAVFQDDINTCPICLDDLGAQRTVTSCGHHYCAACIREYLGQGSAPCPNCRTGALPPPPGGEGILALPDTRCACCCH